MFLPRYCQCHLLQICVVCGKGFNHVVTLSMLPYLSVNKFSGTKGEPINCTAVLDATAIRTNPLGCDFNSNTCGYKLSGLWKRNNTYSYHGISIPSGISKQHTMFVDDI